MLPELLPPLEEALGDQELLEELYLPQLLVKDFFLLPLVLLDEFALHYYPLPADDEVVLPLLLEPTCLVVVDPFHLEVHKLLSIQPSQEYHQFWDREDLLLQQLGQSSVGGD